MPIFALLRRHPSALLLAAQLISLVLFPIMDNSTSGRLVFAAVGAVVVVLALFVVNRTPAVTQIAWLLAGIAIGLSALSLLLDRPRWVVWSSLFESLLYFYVAGGLISYMLHDHVVTGDELFAAGATFTLLAWGFAYAFFVCQAWYPHSFTALQDPEAPRTWLELLYLSFANLSGVGLSDVMPLSPPARVLVMLEQFAGVGYIAAIVSRLIGLTIRDRR